MVSGVRFPVPCGDQGVKWRMCPPYPQPVVKGAVKKFGPVSVFGRAR